MMQSLSEIDDAKRTKRLASATGVTYPTGYIFFRGTVALISKFFIVTKLYHNDRIPQPKGYLYKPGYYSRNGYSRVGDYKAFIIAANHGQVWDIPFIGMFRRGLIWVCKPQFCIHPALAWVNQRMGAVPVFRPSVDGNTNKNSAERIKKLQMASYTPQELIPVVVKALKRGVPAIMFPEGSRVGTSTVEDAKFGAAKASFLSGCPILPIALVGCSKGDKVIRRGLLRRRLVIGVVGDLIYPESYMHLESNSERYSAMMNDWVVSINELREEGSSYLK
jgi:1-acyl-sn-glycerol-3-phosphate acyltransferase